MALQYERPLPRLGTFSPYAKAQRAATEDRADRAARRNWAIASLCVRLADAGVSFSRMREHVARATEAGLIPMGPTPTRQGLHLLVRRWRAGATDTAAYRPAERAGRPETAWDDRLLRLIRDACESDGAPNVAAVARAVATAAGALKIDCPSYATIKRLVAAHGRLGRTAARHGRRAAELDATPHACVPAARVHDVWTIDAFEAPWCARGWDEALQMFVAITQWVIAVRDRCAGTIVGYHVTDPTRRRNEAGAMMRDGFDGDDVLAALCSAALRELAPAPTRAYAGYLCRTLRMDNHSTHSVVRTALERLATAGAVGLEWDAEPADSASGDDDIAPDEDLIALAGPDVSLADAAGAGNSTLPGSGADTAAPAGGTPAGVPGAGTGQEGVRPSPKRGGTGPAPIAPPPADFADREEARADSGAPVRVPKLPIGRPANRGHIERGGGFLKALCADMPNHVDRVVPVETLKEDPRETRTRYAQTTSRVPRRTPVAVRRLPTAAEAARGFGDRVRYFNEEHPHARQRTTAAFRYRQRLPPKPRAGRDLLLALPTRVAHVTKDGITHWVHGVAVNFPAELASGRTAVRLPIDAEVKYKADPLGRAIYPRVFGETFCLKPAEEWASAEGRARAEAVAQHAPAAEASDRATARRAAQVDAAFGAGTAAEGDELA